MNPWTNRQSQFPSPGGGNNWVQRQNPARNQTSAPQPQQPDMSSFANYLQGGHLPGVGGGGNQNAELATVYGNMANQQAGNANTYQNYMQGLMGQNPVTQFKNPYQQQMGQVFQNMQNAPSTQQSATNWMQQFNPLMQGGGQMNFGNPQLRQTELGQGAQNFIGGNSQANQYGAPGLGVGGDIAQRIAQMQQPQGGGNGQGQQAGNAALSGYLGLQNQPGMSAGEIETQAQGVLDPLTRRLMQQQAVGESGLSARGLGRSSAVSQLMGETQGVLGDAAQRTYGDLTAQNVGLRNNNRLAALSGLTGLQGQFTGQDQNQQGLAQNWFMNQGNLGLNLGQAGQAGQLATNQLNQQAGNDAFSQNATRAGMVMDLYNNDANRAMQELEGNRSWNLNTQGMQSDNQYRNANMANSNLLSLLGMGGNAGQQDFSNQSSLLQGLLGAGNQAQNAWATNQGNQLNQLGMQGDLANSWFGNQTGQYNQDRNFYEMMRQYGLNRQDQLDAQNSGGGLGGLLGGIGGTLLGSALGPIGAGIGGKIGNWITNSGGSSQPISGVANPHFNPFQLSYGYGG